MSLHADILKLKQGGGVQGTLVSANSLGVVFAGLDGASQSYPLNAVSGIEFAPLPPQQQRSRTASAAADVLTVPTGTQITVRTIDNITGETAKPGMRYRASIDDPVMVGSQTAIPRGAACTLEVVSLQQQMAQRKLK